LIVEKTNKILADYALLDSCWAILVGQDGWHLTRSQLDAFPDPKLAHDRRGIHWTFDGMAYLEYIKQLRTDSSGDNAVVITAPTFDHAVKVCPPSARLEV
jgi:pantothenate kinase